jgi:hypothetical protein
MEGAHVIAMVSGHVGDSHPTAVSLLISASDSGVFNLGSGIFEHLFNLFRGYRRKLLQKIVDVETILEMIE